MKNWLLIASVLLSALSASADGTNILRSASELAAAVAAIETGRPFDLDVTVTFSLRNSSHRFMVRDATGSVALIDWLHTPDSFPRAGDRLHVSGLICGDNASFAVAKCRACRTISRGTAPQPVQADAAGLLDGAYDYQPVQISGTVRDVFRDEIDRDWDYLVLSCEGQIVYVTFPSEPASESLIGAEVSIVGVCDPSMNGRRRPAERFVLTDGRNGISVLRTPVSDPFGAPDISGLRHVRAEKIATLGRHRARGRVLARRQGNRLILRTKDRQTVGIELTDVAPPAVGTTIEAVGLPETDFYKLNLTRAIWRETPDLPIDDPPVTNVSVRLLTADDNGRKLVNPAFDGRTIALNGLVRSIETGSERNGRLYLESDGQLVPVDVSGCQEILSRLTVGCGIEATGVCVMEAENWRPNTVFPRIRGFSIVVRSPDDIRILSYPPWWTPTRLFAVIGTLLVILLAIVIWNSTLRRIVERRSRELKKEITAHVTAALKVVERTRLAVELHDSVAQQLTGVALEIDAAEDFADTDQNQMRTHLGIASKTLKSCRDELRNCLWDLRNQALEDGDMNDAIRRTLSPHTAGIALNIRFNVPRARLSDNTTHTLLRIVRELTVNAVRHGHATEVKVAGSLENNRLLFSVRDNGHGFDPEKCPGMRQGHFGLQGVRERVAQYEGTMTIDSTVDHGTKVTISINAPYDEEEK